MIELRFCSISPSCPNSHLPGFRAPWCGVRIRDKDLWVLRLRYQQQEKAVLWKANRA
ncbi:unnamed protein product [Musa hybrid cultivar]